MFNNYIKMNSTLQELKRYINRERNKVKIINLDINTKWIDE